MIDSTLSLDLHEIRARMQIKDALMRYCRGVDRLDKDLVLSAFHPRARDNHGFFDGPIEEFVDDLISRQRRTVETSTHLVGNVFIVVDGDVARCESYVNSYARMIINDELQDMIGLARYVDRFEFRNLVWKIAERMVVVDRTLLSPVEPGNSAGGGMSKLNVGTRDRQDPSYQIFDV